MIGRKGQLGSIIVVIAILLVIGLLPVILTMAGWTNGSSITKFVSDVSGVEQALLVFPQYLWYVVLPYAATVAILIGLFDTIGIFSKALHPERYYFIIALGWAGVLIPTKLLFWITTVLYGFGTIVGIGAFMAVFVLGSIMLVVNPFKKTRGAMGMIGYSQTQISRWKNERDRKLKELRNLKPADYAAKASGLKNEIAELELKMRDESKKMFDEAVAGD